MSDQNKYIPSPFGGFGIPTKEEVEEKVAREGFTTKLPGGALRFQHGAPPPPETPFEHTRADKAPGKFEVGTGAKRSFTATAGADAGASSPAGGTGAESLSPHAPRASTERMRVQRVPAVMTGSFRIDGLA